jgi:hypothetical protein
MKIKELSEKFPKKAIEETILGTTRRVWSDPIQGARVPIQSLLDACEDVLVGTYKGVVFEGFLWPTAPRLYKSRHVIISGSNTSVEFVKVSTNAYIDVSVLQDLLNTKMQFRLDIQPTLKPIDSFELHDVDDWLDDGTHPYLM